MFLENGAWSNWETDSDDKCEQNGLKWYKNEQRFCNNPKPKYGGDDCNGMATKSIECDPSM